MSGFMTNRALGWSDITLFAISETGTTLPISYIFMSPIPKKRRIWPSAPVAQNFHFQKSQSHPPLARSFLKLKSNNKMWNFWIGVKKNNSHNLLSAKFFSSENHSTLVPVHSTHTQTPYTVFLPGKTNGTSCLLSNKHDLRGEGNVQCTYVQY